VHLRLGAGTGEERMLKPALAMHDTLEQAASKRLYQSPFGHEWQTWRGICTSSCHCCSDSKKFTPDHGTAWTKRDSEMKAVAAGVLALLTLIVARRFRPDNYSVEGLRCEYLSNHLGIDVGSQG
jgi:hypothetical protein